MPPSPPASLTLAAWLTGRPGWCVLTTGVLLQVKRTSLLQPAFYHQTWMDHRSACSVHAMRVCCDACCVWLQALITFLYVDFLDATGTLFSMVRSTLHIDVQCMAACARSAEAHCMRCPSGCPQQLLHLTRQARCCSAGQLCELIYPRLHQARQDMAALDVCLQVRLALLTTAAECYSLLKMLRGNFATLAMAAASICSMHLTLI
jgi:hypothetical protein